MIMRSNVHIRLKLNPLSLKAQTSDADTFVIWQALRSPIQLSSLFASWFELNIGTNRCLVSISYFYMMMFLVCLCLKMYLAQLFKASLAERAC